MKKKKFTLDNSISVSNPGVLNFKPMVWVQHDLETVSAFVAALLLFVVLGFTYSYKWFLVVLCMVLASIYYFVRASEHFSADSNLGVIISNKPLLLAVYTGLTKGYGSYRVIKIIEFKSKKRVRVGAEIGTVSTYSRDDKDSFLYSNEDVPYWFNFYPLPVTYATDDVSLGFSRE